MYNYCLSVVVNGINHITGGVVFTGVFSSFWDVNIFEKPEYLAVCVITSVLPDIDHTKSPIGKLFFPISRYLDRNFGHRTITHSLLFLLFSSVVFYFASSFFLDSKSLSLIFFFAFLSHLIFDMMTIAGVPLFYPFMRNPCVLPSNPRARFNSNFKTQSLIFLVFLGLFYFCYPLMKNGFWLSYNRNFNTLTHLNSSFKKFDQALTVQYNFEQGNEEKKGKGTVLNSVKNQAVILSDEKEIIRIKSADKIRLLQSSLSGQKIQIVTRHFHDASIQEIQKYSDQVIQELKINSTKQFIFNNQLTAEVHENYLSGFQIREIPADSSELKKQLFALQRLKAVVKLRNDSLSALKRKKAIILQKTKSGSDYEKEIAINELKILDRQIEGFRIDSTKLLEQEFKANQEKEKLRKRTTFSGSIKLVEFLKLPPA